uniref:NADH-ubiquinone oxidoreductase chain 2 n=1 Tax=Bemisia afer TaxID=166114 RepID=A0A023IZ78_BEMAF|nr:NADH dehydrogenase subunit 2 [Bemisia afer]AHC02250.1 NADH dehydrogenase subunit 2 [Bemisia afer]
MSYMKLFSCYGIIYLSVVGWTSNNWLMMWFMMEVCLVLFLGLTTLGGGYGAVEFMIKYFIVQVFFSLLLLMHLVYYLFNLVYMDNLVVLGFLMVKVGLFPFHSWLLMLLGKLDWLVFFMVAGPMKLIPVLMLYLTFSLAGLLSVSVGSLIAGSLGGVNNTSLQKILGYSSMVSLCWVFFSLSVSFLVFLFYFGGYLILTLWLCVVFKQSGIFYMNQFKLVSWCLSSKIIMFVYVLSISGFPPFLGFMMKWVVVSSLAFVNMKLMISLMVLFSVVSTYFYLQMFFYVMMVYAGAGKWYGAPALGFKGWALIVPAGYIVAFMIY